MKAAHTALRKAIKINPNNARAFQWLAQYYLYKRKYNEAISYIQRAKEIEPLSTVIVTESAWPYIFLGQYNSAIAILQQAIKLDNQFYLTHFNLAQIFDKLHQYDKALSKYRLAAKLSSHPLLIAHYAVCLIKTGQLDEAKGYLKDLLTLSKTGLPISVCIAFIYDALENEREAISWLEKAIKAREPMILWINTISFPFKHIVDKASFLELFKKLPDKISAVILAS